jgi:hypothetical protein
MALPDWVKPQLTKLLDQRLDGPEWLGTKANSSGTLCSTMT